MYWTCILKFYLILGRHVGEGPVHWNTVLVQSVRYIPWFPGTISWNNLDKKLATC